MANDALLNALLQRIRWGYGDLKEADLEGADLEGANLRGFHLKGVIFAGANLYGANLYGADLRRANLEGADLEGADLEGADLRWAILGGESLEEGAIFYGANVRRADLRGANVRRAIFRGANFEMADLRETNLTRADLRAANLHGVDLHGVDLHGVDLRAANLTRADLRETNLTRADLSQANLEGADLCDADLRRTTLVDSRLDGANLTSAKLWQTQRDGWSIKGVICPRAFLDRAGKEPSEFEVGGFERVFAEKPRIILRYSGVMSPIDLIMLPLIVERLQAEHPDCVLHVRSMQDDGSGATVIITVDDLANRSAEVFESDIAALRSRVTMLQDRLREFKHRLREEEKLKLVFEAKYQTVAKILQPMLDTALRTRAVYVDHPTGQTLIGGDMSSDNYNTTAGQIAAVGREAHVHDNTFQQIWNQAGIDLPKLREELGRLLSAMRREATEGTGTPEQDEAIDAVAAAEKAAARGDGPTALRHLKVAGKWTLGFAEKICVAVAAEAIKRAAMG